MPNDSTRTVLVALGAGLGVALAKLAAAVFTGSAALAAEAAHSLADSGNDLSLFVAQRRSSRPSDAEHPLGYGREACVAEEATLAGSFYDVVFLRLAYDARGEGYAPVGFGNLIDVGPAPARRRAALRDVVPSGEIQLRPGDSVQVENLPLVDIDHPS